MMERSFPFHTESVPYFPTLGWNRCPMIFFSFFLSLVDEKSANLLKKRRSGTFFFLQSPSFVSQPLDPRVNPGRFSPRRRYYRKPLPIQTHRCRGRRRKKIPCETFSFPFDGLDLYVLFEGYPVRWRASLPPLASCWIDPSVLPGSFSIDLLRLLLHSLFVDDALSGWPDNKTKEERVRGRLK